MITETFREKFKTDLGDRYNYTPEVKEILKKAQSKNRDGKAWSSASIRLVFNGSRENEAIEIAIIECYEKGVERKKRLETLKNKHKKN